MNLSFEEQKEYIKNQIKEQKEKLPRIRYIKNSGISANLKVCAF